MPSDDRRRGASPPPTAFFSPAPAGYPQAPVPQEFGYAPAAPRFTPVDRQAEQDEDNRTRILERPADRARPTGPQRAADNTSPNLARSSRAMAFGTIASRGTGFLRTLVLIVALGGGPLADAYNNSNTLPNTVYYLMLGGIFTSVVVPLLVRAAKEDPDRGEGYAERIFTLGVISLLVVTVLGTLLAGPLVDLYAGNINGTPGSPGAAEHNVMVIFAYFFIPQIFFYGMDALLGAILNTRGRFGANMWTPVINNVVVILVGGLFILTEGLHRTPQDHLDRRHRPARHRHHARHRDPVDLPVPGAAPCRVQHAAALGPAARRDRRDRPDGRLDVRLRRSPSGSATWSCSGSRTPLRPRRRMPRRRHTT